MRPQPQPGRRLRLPTHPTHPVPPFGRRQRRGQGLDQLPLHDPGLHTALREQVQVRVAAAATGVVGGEGGGPAAAGGVLFVGFVLFYFCFGGWGGG